jgi:hypothetical protein
VDIEEFIVSIAIMCSWIGTPFNKNLLKTDILWMMDKLELFDRSGDNTPFLLLDGHHSRLGLEFLEYIHSPEHFWRGCSGVPYATHVWQPNDSSELNSTFKIALAKLKRSLSWAESFVKFHNIKILIAERGWGPLDYVLLKHDVFDHSKAPSVPEENMLETSHPTVINVEGTSEFFIFKLLKKMMQNEGIIHKYRDHEEQDQLQQTLYEKLKKEVKLTSGSLTRNEVFCLNTMGVLLTMQEKADETKQKATEANARKIAQDEKMKEHLRLAVESCLWNKALKVPELRVLIKHFCKETDPPMAKGRDALDASLWSRKHKFNKQSGRS